MRPMIFPTLTGAEIVELLSAASTVALGVFAGVELWREHQRQSRIATVARGKASALGYILRRRLRTWLGPDSDNENDLERWLRAARNDQRFEKELAAAEADI